MELARLREDEFRRLIDHQALRFEVKAARGQVLVDYRPIQAFEIKGISEEHVFLVCGGDVAGQTVCSIQRGCRPQDDVCFHTLHDIVTKDPPDFARSCRAIGVQSTHMISILLPMIEAAELILTVRR